MLGVNLDARLNGRPLDAHDATDLACTLSGEVDKTATVDFLGWVIAACSFGCAVANPLFGLWNQKTLSIKAPVVVGMIMMLGGQAIFGLLPLLNANQKWVMLFARLLTGFGAGDPVQLQIVLGIGDDH
ncbi:hypothetical protein TELCIR_04424 [Teladorsagia circumcincta]|uniref:Major facilitator superfamily (MFS) profile domain-containing protein n=1 Tax=Teladorsagia circumcincta TaxID=45464 RepID=A0A2G9UTN6_TELCI|nr:hypothetical protein TELCIR_04424 [Teladorsagia circumcincta]